MPPRPHHVWDEAVVSTSIRLPKSLLNRAKIQAINDSLTLQALLVEALLNELTRRTEPTPVGAAPPAATS